MRSFIFVFFISLIYCQFHSSEWASITSLLTPTGIQITDNGIIYASTSGGLLKFNSETQQFYFIKMEEGLLYLDLATLSMDSQGRLWMGGGYPRGCLQVYDPEIGLVKYFEDDLIESINKIQIGEEVAFAVYQGTTSGDIGILKFDLDADGIPEYKDFYNDFSNETITEIRDLDIVGDLVYITTEKGVFKGNYMMDILQYATSWEQIYSAHNAFQYLPNETGILITDNLILTQSSGGWENYCVGITGNIIQAARHDERIGVLTQERFYEIVGCELKSLSIPVGDQSNTSNAWDYDLRTFFTSFDYSQDGNVFIGVQDNGIIAWNAVLETYSTFTPNTSITNAFQAITITKSGNLAATSHFGTLFYNGTDYKNYIPNNYYKYYSGDSETFHALSLDYQPGQHEPISIIEKDNGHIIYCNSGVLPGWGTVIELDHTTGIITKYDNTEEIIDGWDGINAPGTHTHYMLVNQIEKDKIGNIWVVNPFSEKYGNLLAIQLVDDESWAHVEIPDRSSFLPQTVAFQEHGSSSQRAWIGFAYDALEDSTIYSSGGIKVLNNAIISLDGWADTAWLSISNPNVLPGNDPDASIWSLVFDEMNILWVLSEKGVQGYEVRGSNELELDPLRIYLNDQNEEVPVNFLTQHSFVKGNRIRVDSQNNKWIISHQGLWVIQESMEYWPSEEGLNSENSGLLSDIVYDVAFDNDKGLAYLATKKGISILQIPFADNPTKAESIYLSPNPFIIPDNEYITIKNIPSGAIIQIITISGILIRTIELEAHISQTTWDGRNSQGEVVGTAVYLVAAHHPKKTNMVSKVAVIRK